MRGAEGWSRGLTETYMVLSFIINCFTTGHGGGGGMGGMGGMGDRVRRHAPLDTDTSPNRTARQNQIHTYHM